MFDEQTGLATGEQTPSQERFPLEREYGRCLKTLVEAGVVSILPGKDALGVVGFDDEEYAVPTAEEVSSLLDKNKELVGAKMGQGFKRLQLVPFATTLLVLRDQVKGAIVKHVKEGKIFQAKRSPSDPDVPVSVNTEEPVWMLDEYLAGKQKWGGLVYFPKAFTPFQGIAKPALIQDRDICAVPGWSVTLVEDSPFLAQERQGQTVVGRKQIENNQSPEEYLQTLQQVQYQGETGFTPEDFLINFLTRLEETNQVSHDWDDASGTWLTGAYFPFEGFVPAGFWYRAVRGLTLGRGDLGVRHANWGAPSTVRLKP